MDFILTKCFDRLLPSDALESALVAKIGSHPPHLNVNPNKGTSSGKIENMTIKNDHLVSDTEFSSKVSDDNSVMHDRHDGRKAGKTTKRRSRRKGRKSKKHNHSSSSSPASDAESNDTLSDPREESTAPESEQERRHRAKKHSGDGLDIIHTAKTRFRRTINYKAYRLANKSLKDDHTVSEKNW